MTKFKIVLSLLIFSFFNCYSQSFTIESIHSFDGTGDNFDRSIKVDQNDNVYFLGVFKDSVYLNSGIGQNAYLSNGEYDIFLSKFDSSGTYLWSIHIGGTGYDQCYDLTIDNNGNLYLTGYFRLTVDFDPGSGVSTLTALGGKDIFILKLNSNGIFQWVKRIGGNAWDESLSIKLDSSGSIFIAGYFEQNVDFDPGSGSSIVNSNGDSDVFIAKYNSNGEFLWVNHFGDNGYSEAYGMEIDSNGNVYITGMYAGNVDVDPSASVFSLISSGNDAFIVSYNNDGDFRWATSVGGFSNSDRGLAILYSEGNIYSSGVFKGIIDFDPGAQVFELSTNGLINSYLLKLDTLGNFIWVSQIEGLESGSYSSPQSLIVDENSNILMLGSCIGKLDFCSDSALYHIQYSENLEVFLCSFSSNSDLNWNKTFKTNEWQYDNLYRNIMCSNNGDDVYMTLSYSDSVNFVSSAGEIQLYSGNTYNALFMKLSPCVANYDTVFIQECNFFVLTNEDTIFESGVYNMTYTNSQGCDSIIKYQIEIINPTISMNIEECDFYISPSGSLYTESGIFWDTLTTGGLCDSIFQINLTLQNSYDTLIYIDTCKQYVLNGNLYTNSTVVIDSFSTVSGCDSVIHYDMSIFQFDSILTNGSTLIAPLADSYQWVHCNNFVLINGAVDQYYTPESGGSFAVIVNYNDCIDTTDCVELLLGINSEVYDRSFILYPNPSKNYLNVNGKAMVNCTYQIINNLGDVILCGESISENLFLDTSWINSGFYIIEIQNFGQTIRKRLIIIK